MRHPHSYDHITLLNYDHISIMATSHMACHISWCPRFEESQKTCVDAVLLHLDRIQNTHTEYSSCFQKGSPVLQNGHTNLIQKHFTYVIDVKPLKFEIYLPGDNQINLFMRRQPEACLLDWHQTSDFRSGKQIYLIYIMSLRYLCRLKTHYLTLTIYIWSMMGVNVS